MAASMHCHTCYLRRLSFASLDQMASISHSLESPIHQEHTLPVCIDHGYPELMVRAMRRSIDSAMDENTTNASLPVPITVLDWDRELLSTQRWNEIEGLLVNLNSAAEPPNAIVDIIHPTCGTLSVGVAGLGDHDNVALTEPLACVNHTPASRNPPYLSIVGDRELPALSGGVVIFRYERGTWTEIPRRNCVSIVFMVEVVKHFCFHGNLSGSVDWEEI
jgi:hypothetical protein